MKATLSYKSKRNIIIASVIVVLLAAISTAGYFYIKGNDETARAFTQNEITNELTPGEQTQNNGGQQENQPQNPEQPATPGEQNNNGGEQTPNSQTNNGQNQNNNQNRPNNNTTNNGSTPNQTTGNVPNQEYVTERTEERTTITKEYSVEWTPESITANASVQNLNIIRPIISANKSADKNAVVPGEIITYTITVTNTGNADGKAIVKDTIPEATEFIENSIKINGEDTNYTAQNLEEGITVDVAKQNEQGEAGTVEVEFKVKVSNIFAQYEKASIINQATVNEEETNEVKNPVIKFEKSANKEKVKVGDTVTYTISIENIGDAEGTVIVKDTIPTGTKLVENSTIKLNGEDTNYTEQILNDGIELKVKSGERLEITFEVEVLSEITEAVKNTAYVNDIPTETIPTQVESLIKFESNGGTLVESMNGYTGDVIENREMPTTTREGYTFDGWYAEPELTNKVETLPEKYPAGTTTYYAKWTKNSYKITYKIVGDYFTNNNYKEETLEYGAQITPEANPTQEGYTFSGWSEIPETMPANDVVVEGSYTKNSYKITYKIVGDYFTNNNYKEETLEYGAQITPEANPTQEGYTFSGWSEIPETMPANDVVVEGSYTKNSYKITYKIVGDYFTNNNYKEETLEYGAQITPEANPTQEGYTFSGWSEIPETMPANDVVVEGSYTKNSYKITYKIVGDYFTNNNYKEETLEYGAQITPEANPTQEGYTFSGWSEIPETMPAHDIVVEGSYTRNNYQYKVQYWYENEQGTYEHLETVIGEKVPYGTVIDTFTPKDGDGKYVLDHVDPAKSATDNKTANLVITHKESENILNVYYKRNSFNYKIEYYKEIANGEEFITSTGNKQQKLKTKITDEILKADFGANWKNVNKPQKGYQDGIVKDAEATDYYITIKESENVIKVVYKLKTNIEYKVKYYFNEKEDPSKEYSGTAKYGQQINSVKDYSDGGWEKSSKSTSLPYTIKESGNVIKVYYVKPDITAKKTIWQDSTKLKDDAIVEAGSTVTYKITASNAGYLAGNVTIKDEELPQGNVTNITATGHTETLTVQDLKDGIVLNVPAQGTAEVTITIKLTGAIGTPISNTAKYDDTKTNRVENNVEKTVALKAKAEQVQVLNTNVILVMDISYSMNDRPVCTDHTTEKEHRDARCSKRGDKWLKKDKKIDIAKTVINNFIDSVKLPDQVTTDSSIIEVIKFNGWPDVVGKASNSQSKNDLKAKVNKLVETGGTWYSRPLAMTTEEITKLTEERPDNRNIVIFVSDGEPAKQDKKIIDEADKLKAVPNTTVYTVGFDADIEILKQIATDYGKYRTTDQASSLNTIFNEIVDEIAIKTEKKQSVSGKIELSNVDLSKTNKVVIKVNGTAISADKVQAAIVTENSKYYIDLNKLKLSSLHDDVLIEYFIDE